MPPKRNPRRKPNRLVKAAPWSQGMGSGFYPSAFMSSQPMSAYMQAALGQDAVTMFGMGRSSRLDYSRDYGADLVYDYDFDYDYDDDYDFDYEEMQSPYFRVSNKSFNDRGSRGRNYQFRRNKRPNNQGGTSVKRARTDKDSTAKKSPGQGANAPSEDWKNTSDRQSRYCTVCEEHFDGRFYNHKRELSHRKNKEKRYPHCHLCHLTFSGVEEFEAHNKTPEHKKMNKDFELLKQQQMVHAALSDSEDENTALQNYIGTQEPDNITGDAEPVGMFHVVPLKVYFCKLCQKLFPGYITGRQIHCKTPAHIQAYKVYFDGKEERAAERDRLKEEQKKKKALLNARLRKEKLAKEGGGAAEEMAVVEEVVSDDDEKQDEEKVATEDENQLIAEEEQSNEDYEGDATNQEQEWQEEANIENKTDT